MGFKFDTRGTVLRTSWSFLYTLFTIAVGKCPSWEEQLIRFIDATTDRTPCRQFQTAKMKWFDLLRRGETGNEMCGFVIASIKPVQFTTVQCNKSCMRNKAFPTTL
ncbi:hypothetical protein V8E53_001160, partial [Lactarius tabidus]